MYGPCMNPNSNQPTIKGHTILSLYALNTSMIQIFKQINKDKIKAGSTGETCFKAVTREGNLGKTNGHVCEMPLNRLQFLVTL